MEVTIFKISVYRSRLFEVVHKKGSERHIISLEPGSLITMQGRTQSYLYFFLLNFSSFYIIFCCL